MNEFREKILYLLEIPRTRKELMEILNAPSTTVLDNLQILIKMGLVAKYPKKTCEKQGRPKIYFYRKKSKEKTKQIKELFDEINK